MLPQYPQADYGLQKQSKKPYNKQLINLECSLGLFWKILNLGLAILTLLSLSQYGKVLATKTLLY